MHEAQKKYKVEENQNSFRYYRLYASKKTKNKENKMLLVSEIIYEEIMKTLKPKIPSMATVDKKASEYIRRKYADDNGYVKCITCRAVKHWKEIDCGHFIKREVLALRYSEYNMHPQCAKCNRFKGGREARYSRFIIKKYGIEVFNYLLDQECVPFTGSKALFLIANNEKYKKLLKEV